MTSNERPGLLRANASYLLAGAGLVLLNVFSADIVRALRFLFGDIGAVGTLLGIDAVYYAPFLLAPVVIFASRGGVEWLRPGPLKPGLAVACVCAAVLCVPLVNAVSVFWSVLLESFGLTLSKSFLEIGGTGELALAVLTVGVLPGVCEELLFRGTMLSAYERGGTARAIVITSVMFAALHGSLEGLPAQFIVGLVLGYAVYASDSIYAGMAIHTLYNSFLIMVNFMTRGADYGEYVNMYSYIGGAQGLAVAAVEGIVAVGILIPLMRVFRNNALIEGITPAPRGRLRMDIYEKLVLVSAVVTVISLYAVDALELMGYM